VSSRPIPYLALLRIPLPSMRNLRVRWKLVAAVAGPTVLAAVLAGSSVTAQVTAAADYSRIDTLTTLDSRVTALIQTLQQERDVTSGYIAANRSSTVDRDRAEHDVDTAIQAYQLAAHSVASDADSTLRDNLAAVDDELAGIGFVRQAAQAASLTRASVLGVYSETIAKLATLATGIVDSRADRTLVDDERAIADFLTAAEFTSQLRAELDAIATTGTFALGDAQDLNSLRVQRRAALDAFQSDANDAQLTAFTNTVEGVPVTQVEVMLDSALAQQNARRLDLDPTAWYQTTSTVLGKMGDVETRLLAQESSDITTLQSQATIAATLAALALLGAIAVAGGASALGARSITRPVQRLRTAALDVAHRQLPQVAAELRRTNGASVVDLEMPFLGADSTDEFGELKAAFIAFRDGFMSVANQIAAVHARGNEIVANLSMRSQSLVHGLLLSLDKMERDELDPDQLAKLFEIDRQATRLRRLNNTQLVLSGSRPVRRSHATALADVLGAAISEVDQFARISATKIPDVALHGRVVNEVVHLLAELLDNATHYSQPDTWVVVSGSWTGNVDDDLFLVISDSGSGMSPSALDRANDLLRNPDAILASGSHAMGHQAVSRLASFHDITVTLCKGHPRGIAATVQLPAGLLTDPPAAQPPAPSIADTASLSAATPVSVPPGPPPALVAGPAMVAVADARYAASSRNPTSREPVDRSPAPSAARARDENSTVASESGAPGTFSLAELMRLRRYIDSISIVDSPAPSPGTETITGSPQP
jgi:hypothetical protein